MSDEEKGDPFRMRIQSLNAHNYFVWSNEMEILLRGKGLWRYVSDENAPMETMSSNKKDLALAYLMMSIDASCKGTVMTLRDPFEVWQKLKKSYQAVSEAAIDGKLTKLQQIRMGVNEAVIKYSNRIENLVNELEAAGHCVSSLEKKRALLRGLRSEFLVVAQVIRTTGQGYTEAVSQLIVHESNSEVTVSDSTTALLTPQRNGDNWKKKKKCFHCGKKGHFKHECWSNPDSKKFKGKSEEVKDESRSEETGDATKKSIAFLTMAMVTKQNGNSSRWMVDCACTRHICNDKSSFSKLVCANNTVQVGNQDCLAAHGSGSVSLSSMVDGVELKLELHDVLYCPQMMYNLISSSATRKKGLRTEIDDDGNNTSKGMLRIIHKRSGSVCLLAPETVDGLYEASVRVQKSESALSSVTPAESIWHSRMGHVSPDRLLKTAAKVHGLDASLTRTTVPHCHSCALGKATRHQRISRPLSSSKAKAPLERVYTDVVGPISASTFGGARYFVTLLDEYSGYSMVRFMREKGDASERVKEMIKSMETGLSIRLGKLLILNRSSVRNLRSDGGGEYIGSEFSQWLKLNGIHHELTTPYSPESNGHAERLNRTLIDMARCMMISVTMKQAGRLWGEAINTANYLRNRLVTRSTSEDKTPYEIFHGRRPDVSRIRIFGCTAYVHIPKQKQASKFDARAKEGVLVGYCKGNAYRVFMEDSGKVLTSQDVSFDERNFGSENTGFEMSNSIEFEVDALEKDFVENDFEVSDIQEEPHQNLQSNVNAADDIAGNNGELQSPGSFDNDSVSNQGIGDSDNLTYYPNLRRSARRTAGVPPERFEQSNICLLTEIILSIDALDAPCSYEEATNSAEKQHWMRSMSEEFQALKDKKVWSLVPLPNNRKAIGTRWVYDVKYGADEKVMRRRARIVAKGFSQKAGVDYFDVFSPVCRYTTARFLIAISAFYGWKRIQLDVKTAFLNADLQEEIYVEQPQGFTVSGREHFVYRLYKALYGLKQASRMWQKTLEEFLTSLGFSISSADPSMFVHFTSGLVTLLVVYVDDIMMTGNNDKFMENFTRSIMERFTVRNCKSIEKFLGMNIEEKDGFIKIHHRGMIQRLLKLFGMSTCNPSSVPITKGTDLYRSRKESEKLENPKLFQQLIGALLHLSNTTRPDITFATNYLARQMQNPTAAAWKSAKGVLRYLKGSSSFGLHYGSGGDPSISGFSDSDWGQEMPGRKSIGGFVFKFGGAAISWQSKKQPVVAQSTVEAEYIALANAVREALWFRKFEVPRGLPGETFGIVIGEDNQGCISLSEDRIVNNKSKHIDVRYQLIMDNVRKGIIKIVYVGTTEMVADIMTKALHFSLFQRFRKMLGMRE